MGYRLRPLPPARFVRSAQRLAWLAVPLALFAILATRSGQVEPFQGLVLLVTAVVFAVAALAIGAVAAFEIWQSGASGLGRLFKAAMIALIVLVYPLYLTVLAIQLPAIHDITTDLADPPSFSRSRAAMEARGGHVPAVLDSRLRNLQAQAYPALKTLSLEAENENAFGLVVDAVKAMGWKIVEETPPSVRGAAGRIEAIAETRLMRFKDDITIRIRPMGNEVRIDVRSASRVGKHDFGANARRITQLFEEINANKE